jgi:hypothetical protein
VLNSLTEVLFAKDQFGRIDHSALNTGFFYATPTPFVRNLFHELKQELVNHTDQNGLKLLVNRQYRFDKRIEVLDDLLYPTGFVYHMNRLNAKFEIAPMIYHANYFPTFREKLASLRELGFWFIDEHENVVC